MVYKLYNLVVRNNPLNIVVRLALLCCNCCHIEDCCFSRRFLIRISIFATVFIAELKKKCFLTILSSLITRVDKKLGL